MSAASDVFFGDIEQHEPEGMSFADFLALAGGRSDAGGVEAGPSTPAAEVCAKAADASASAAHLPDRGELQQQRRYYLAQASIGEGAGRGSDGSNGGGNRSCMGREVAAQSREGSDNGSLAALAADIAPPPLLQALASGELQTNLWMSIRCARPLLNFSLSSVPFSSCAICVLSVTAFFSVVLFQCHDCQRFP